MEHKYNVLKGKPPWDSIELMMFLGTSFFIGLSIWVITTTLINPNTFQGNPPPPPALPIFFLVGLICLPAFLYATQRILGVRAYSVDDSGIVVHHWIGNTRIHFNARAQHHTK